jgi:hypothetical protein
MDFINDVSEVVTTKTTTVHYGIDGAVCDVDKAVISSITVGDKTIYKALIVGGCLYEKSLRFPREKIYRQITEDCAYKYIPYLLTGDHYGYEKASREYRRSH